MYIISQDYEIVRHYTEDSNDVNARLLSNIVRTIEVLDDSNVWVGTLNGLNSLNLLTDQIGSHQSSQHKSSLSLNLILKIYKDNSNNMWIGTNGAGINTFNNLNLIMQHGLVDYSGLPINVIGFAE